MSIDDSHLFKGRLQLQKSGNEIHVIVKGKPAGPIPVAAFKNLPGGLKAMADAGAITESITH
jgi:hypothetical protein